MRLLIPLLLLATWIPAQWLEPLTRSNPSQAQTSPWSVKLDYQKHPDSNLVWSGQVQYERISFLGALDQKADKHLLGFAIHKKMARDRFLLGARFLWDELYQFHGTLGTAVHPTPWLELEGMLENSKDWRIGGSVLLGSLFRLGSFIDNDMNLLLRAAFETSWFDIEASTIVDNWNFAIRIPFGTQTEISGSYTAQEKKSIRMHWQSKENPQSISYSPWVSISLRGKFEETRHDFLVFQGSDANLIQFNQWIDRLLLKPNMIRGILFDFDGYEGNMAASSQIRRRIQELNRKGIQTRAYMTQIRPASLFAASATHRIALQPSSLVHFRGLSSEVTHYWGLEQKLGIKSLLMRHGKYKSAVEPFTRDSLSIEARSNLQSLLDDAWQTIQDSIGASRKITKNDFESLLKAPPLTSSMAQKAKLVDTLFYVDQLNEWIGSNPQPISQAYSDLQDQSWRKKVKIAVVYLEGEIVDGSSGSFSLFQHGKIGGADFSDLVESLHSGDFDAIVLRINSPGGSAQASDILWHRFQTLGKELDIPIIASIGSMAASGGYYLACAADAIWTEPTSILGSIGVFGGKVDLSELRSKLGISSSVVKTHPSADAEGMHRGFTIDEEKLLQASMEDFYSRFTQVVRNSRKLTELEIDSLAEGRVFTGNQAIQNGLADSIGGLQDAIRDALHRSGMDQNASVLLTQIGFGNQWDISEQSLLPIEQTSLWAWWPGLRLLE